MKIQDRRRADQRWAWGLPQLGGGGGGGVGGEWREWGEEGGTVAAMPLEDP